MSADPLADSKEEEELCLPSAPVEDYEKPTIVIPQPTPLEAIRFRMEQEGLKQRDLIPFIGSKIQVAEVLSGKRRLTLGMIGGLHPGLFVLCRLIAK